MSTADPHFRDDDAAPRLRPLPSNVEAEQALLGAIMLNNKAASEVADFLDPEHFSLPVHGRIYEAALAMIGRGVTANPITLKAHFDGDEALSEAGGSAYLARLASSTTIVLNAKHYGRTILDLWARRRLIAAAANTIEQAHAVNWDTPADAVVASLVAEADAMLDQLARGAGQADTLDSVFDRVEQGAEAAHRAGNAIVGIPSGLIALDDLLGGFHAGELVVIAARPAMGKTALALGIAAHAARAGHPVVFFSLEMPSVQLMQRLVAMQTGISASAIRRGQLHADQWHQLVEARSAITNLPLVIDDMPNGATAQGLAAAARRLHARRGLKLVIVDYLQLILPSESAARRNREAEISEISAGLKRLAKSLDVPVVALAQLNRALESRENKRPGLSDLRDSGAIEQDADVVAFIHRPIEYVRRQQPDEQDEPAMQDWRADVLRLEHKAELIIAKHRQGPTATLPLFYDGTRTRFYDAVRQRGN